MSFFHILLAESGVSTYIIPAPFTADFPYNIYRTDQTLGTTYDFDALRASITGNIAYCDSNAAGGGNGTIETPFNSLPTPVANTNFTIYKLKAGSEFIITATGLTISRQIVFERYGDGPDPIISSRIANTWTINGTHSNVYQTPNALTTLTVSSVYDETNLDVNGNYVALVRVASLAAVAATPNSYFYDATLDITYVRTFNDRVLSGSNSTIVCLVNSTTTRLFRFNQNLVANTKIYMEGIRVYGANPLVINNTSTSFYWDFGFKNCRFSYAGQKDGSLISGYAKGFIKDCRADYNFGDGFNYSNSVGFALEWGCSSWYNNANSDSNNGSTSHLAFNVIRVLGDYEFGGGKGVQDINDVNSYNLRCISRNHTAITPAHRAGYASNSAAGNTDMWLIECIGPTNANKFWNFNNSTMNIYDGDYGNLLTGTNQQDVGSVLNLLTEGQVYQ